MPRIGEPQEVCEVLHGSHAVGLGGEEDCSEDVGHASGEGVANKEAILAMANKRFGHQSVLASVLR